MKMTVVFKNGRMYGATPVKLSENSDISLVKAGDKLKVSGTSKGKGFLGVVGRYGFHGGPKTHGQKNRHRGPGSIGNTSPQRVIPGRRMAGRTGMERATTKNVPVIDVKAEEKILFLNGSVPGTIGRKVELRIMN